LPYNNKDEVETKINACQEIGKLNKRVEKVFDELINIEFPRISKKN